MSGEEVITQLRVAPFRCPSCDVEWQDHPGLMSTCASRVALREALEAVLVYCRPPASRGIDENVEYLKAMEVAQNLLGGDK